MFGVGIYSRPFALSKTLLYAYGWIEDKTCNLPCAPTTNDLSANIQIVNAIELAYSIPFDIPDDRTEVQSERVCSVSPFAQKTGLNKFLFHIVWLGVVWCRRDIIALFRVLFGAQAMLACVQLSTRTGSSPR